MDEKKVREAIYCMKSFIDETVCEECDYYETCDHTRAEENAKIAIEALEKQLPKKSELINNGISVCKECGAKVFRHYGFCRDCGQKLDWTVEA